MNHTNAIPILLATLTLPFAALSAGPPLGGLTVAVSSDGGKLVAGGDTRTLLVLDPETLEVEHRQWIERPIVNLAFSQDGGTLAVLDTSDDLLLLDTSDWSVKAEIRKRIGFTVSIESDLVAGHDGSGNGPTVFVHSLTDGAEKFSTTLPKGVKVAALALSSDGGRLAVLTEGTKDAGEAETPSAQIPKDLKGLALDEFKQRNDGKTSTLHLFDLAAGTPVRETKTCYTTNAGATLLFDGDDVIAVNYSNVNARIAPDGETRLFQLRNSFNYGIGLSHDGSLVLTGGLARQSVTKVSDLSGSTSTVEKLPGWPEYWKGFSATAGGGAIYGTTTAYRVFKLDASGTVQASAPVR